MVLSSRWREHDCLCCSGDVMDEWCAAAVLYFCFSQHGGWIPDASWQPAAAANNKNKSKKKTRERFSFPIILATNLLAAEAKTGRRVTMYIGTSLGR
jgi:hypothetical protein